MKQGYLSEYFEGVAAKRLSAVEADRTRSNQHEFQAISRMLEFMGRPQEKTRISARFVYLDDDNPDPVVEDAFLTLYDSRKDQPNRSPEYRFYFPTTSISELASTGDLLVIAKMRDGSLLVIIAESDSSISRQILWLFDFPYLAEPGRFRVKSDLESERDRIEFTSRFILENIGIPVETSDEAFLETMLDRFSGRFPATRVFSAFARSTLSEVNPLDNPDEALIAWMEREEVLFRTLERHLISEKLTKGFSVSSEGKVDVDEFVSFSLSVQNRRKSRVGLALENHLECIFSENGLRFSRNAETENRSKPDFLFPGSSEYHDPQFDALKLTMLGVKSTCKDRWRQVLSEAERIENKHLLTLEAAISTHQTDEMASRRLQLVLPVTLHETYTPGQQKWLMSLEEFRNTVTERQS